MLIECKLFLTLFRCRRTLSLPRVPGGGGLLFPIIYLPLAPLPLVKEVSMSTKHEIDVLREERKEILESSLFGLRDRYARYDPDSVSGRLAHAEFIYRQTLFQERATEAQEQAAEAQESAAKSSKKHSRLMTWSVVILAISALGTFLIAVFG